MIHLPDVNVLLALAWSNHPHHEAAHRWFVSESVEGWATCLLTQGGFLRLSLNPQVVGVRLDASVTLDLLMDLVAHPRHQYVQTSPPLTDDAFADLARRIAGYRQVTDSTLLHVVRANSMKLVSFDRAVATICPWSENLEVLPC